MHIFKNLCLSYYENQILSIGENEMKRFFCAVIALMLLTACGIKEENYENKSNFTSSQNTEITDKTENTDKENNLSNEEFVGLWIPIYEIAPKSYTTADEYENYILSVFKEIADFKINNIFVQVRGNCDSIYPSKYFASNKGYCHNGQLKFDALDIIVKTAHKSGLKIHAWINPYRISSSEEYDINNPIFNYISTVDISTGESFTYIKPSSLDGRRLILNGVREIVENYQVDGIHIDDYFFPTTDESFDEYDYSVYRSQDGVLSLEDWRRENVNVLVSSIYSIVKESNSECVFSISPGGDIDKNYNSCYADIKLWCKCEGFADMIIPQLYYGFENSSMPFEKTLKNWKDICQDSHVKLVAGLAVYKANTEDKYAGAGKSEWQENSDIIKKQIECVRGNELDGFVFFSYNYIFSNSNLKNNEIINIKSVI